MGQEISTSVGDDSNLLARINERTPHGGEQGESVKFPVIIRRPSDHLSSEVDIVLEELDITFTSETKISKIGFPGIKMMRINTESQMVKVGIDDENEGKFLLMCQFRRKIDQQSFCDEMSQLLPNHLKIVKERKFRSDISKTYRVLCESMEITPDPFLLGKLQDGFHERIAKLDLRNYQISSENLYSPLFSSLRWNYGITTIDLSRTGIDDEVLKHFCIQMKFNTSLRRLYLNGISFERSSITEVGAGYLSLLVNSESSRMEHLSLKYSKIGNTGAVLIFETLQSNKNNRMKSIDMSHNMLGDVITKALCSSIEHEESVLKRVNLEDNMLGESFYKRIKVTLEKVDGTSISFHGNPCFEDNEMSSLDRPHLMESLTRMDDVDILERVVIPYNEIQFPNFPDFPNNNNKEEEEEEEEGEEKTTTTTTITKKRELPAEEEEKDEEDASSEFSISASSSSTSTSLSSSQSMSSFSELPSVLEGFYRGISVSVRRVKVLGNLSLTSHLKTESINVFSIQNHPNLVDFHGICFSEGCAYILHEKTDLSLRSFLLDSSSSSSSSSTKQHLTLEVKIRMMLQIIEAIRYLFSKKARCSINSSNIFVRDVHCSSDNIYHPRLRLSDYGFSGISLCHYDFQGPEGFVFTAPELFHEAIGRSGADDSKSLVYSFGMVVFEILGEKRPFHRIDVRDWKKRDKLMELISGKERWRPKLEDLKVMYHQQEEEKEDVAILCDLMRLCWSQEPKERPTVLFIRKFLLKNFVLAKKKKKE